MSAADSRLYPDNAALRQVLEQARDFIDPDRDPPRINNRKLVMKINAVLSRVDAQCSGDCGVLWCCHVRGPDDVYAAPDYVTALAWSDAMNEINWKANSKLNIGDPTSFQDCLIKAVPAPWPHSAEAHAKNLPESIKGFSDPSPLPSTEGK